MQRQIKCFPDKAKLKEFIITKPSSYEMLKGKSTLEFASGSRCQDPVSASYVTASADSVERQVPDLKDPDSRNTAAMIGSKEDDTDKGILPQRVQSLEHSSNEVATPEGLDEFFREVAPWGPAIFIKVLPQIWQCHRESVLIGVLVLKFIQHKGTLGKVSKGVLGLSLCSQRWLTVIISSGLGTAAFSSFHSAWGFWFSS